MCVCVCVSCGECTRVRVCVSELRATMSGMPPTKDGIAIIMSSATPVCPPNDPWMTTVLYEAHLEHVDASEPLWRVPYFGQIVRAGTAEENFKARKLQHLYDAAREDKELGFHAVIGMFGADKIEWRIVSFKSGRRTAMAELADAEEKRLIAEHGGPLRDMDERLTQTLNLTEGGQWGDAAARWAGIDANRRRALNKFKAAMEVHVAIHKSALVPSSYVDEEGYALGTALNHFRRGHMRQGLPEQSEIEAWAESLPKWSWNMSTGSAEWYDACSQGATNRWNNASEEKRTEWTEWARNKSRRCFVEFKASMEAYVAVHRSSAVAVAFIDANGYPLGERLVKFRWGEMRLCLPEQEQVQIVAWAEALPGWSWDGRETEEYWTKRSNAAIDQRKAERRAELIRARPIAKPFVKSKRRRAAMRAESSDTKPSGRSGRKGDNVLYMVSEDGLTIRRVDKDGTMRERDIVGPVVDPVQSNAFETDSD